MTHKSSWFITALIAAVSLSCSADNRSGGADRVPTPGEAGTGSGTPSGTPGEQASSGESGQSGAGAAATPAVGASGGRAGAPTLAVTGGRAGGDGEESTGGDSAAGGPPTGGSTTAATGGENASGGETAAGETAGTAGQPETGGAGVGGTGGEVSTGGVAGSAGFRATGGEPASGGVAGTAGQTTTGTGGVEPCVVPQYSRDCSEVPYFQCGFMGTCEQNVIRVDWHEHVFCGDDVMEEIVQYNCTYTCPEDCRTPGWTESGAELVASACVPAGEGARRVFASSVATAGDFGGIAGGDAICQGLADDNALGGTWKAWLSDAVSSPASTFTRPGAGYINIRGEQVVGSWAELVASSGVINVDETGAYVAGTAMVWTGTDATGVATGNDCGGWLSDSGSGTVGLAGYVMTWSNSTTEGCDVEARLYCFEQ